MNRQFAGPQIPDHILAKRKREEEGEAAAKASSPAATSRQSSEEEDAAPKKKRIAGPAPPPAPLEELPEGSPNDDDSGNESSSSSDDDFGPAPPTASRTEEEEEREAQRRLARFQTAQKTASNDGKPKRDEWMIVPPKSEDWASKVDPTKIKNRKFQTGKGAKAPQRGNSGENTLWTETPEQKRQRLEDEVMGRRKPATQGPADNNKKGVSSAEAEETARRIREYNYQYRGKSLYDEHKQQARFEEDDPSKRAFDREKDIAGGRQISNQQKREMLNRAADFGSRFSSGKYL
ncbi:hypothetical protein FN846DRAFT_913966 [Sphaerosporella brunnea]|uniref:DUF3752 domain-containing protein n=1 Tax=Sphaerosporella brunnea TaxID=1250544 RepID=A0A5J5EE45_9PEZI|nr:hypothetical protein FN846DRAFT_913966 [Sphaerosporella brunnea]